MQERDIFIAALAKNAPERAAYLADACGADREMRRRVDELLAAHAKEQSFFLDAPLPGVQVTLDQRANEKLGAQIGPYKLLQVIGEGGMGVVYMAEQTEPLARRVALKIIKPGMDTRQVIARFEAERQALAIMDHANIARVLDAGTTEAGRPYFVMELVHGVPITKYCDDNHLTPRQRLELFVPVCQAIQHAHQKGIIHRDIKPSNVMVTLYDGKPVPKVIDFGVAKATESAGGRLTERTLFTQYGTMVGTLEYMSPEQAEMSALGVDTRSDIYSLGVLLYELLTGSTPLSHKTMKEAAYAEILRMIKEEEPPKPSTRLSDSREALASISANRHTEPAKLSKLMRGDLDWIVMKTLEKDRNRRYETASDFAADVDRYLNDEPVHACPPSGMYRLRKFGRRNKRGLATAALFGVMMLAAVGAITGTLGWALRDRGAREQELAREAERDLALTEQGVLQSIDQAAKIRGELHAVLAKPGGVQELLNQPGRWNFSIQSARSELAQAHRLAAGAEGSLSAEITQAFHKLEEQIKADEADRLLALRLEKIRMDQATWVEGNFDYRRAADEYPRAFAGFAVLTDHSATVATRISSSPIKDQLVAALDDWAVVSALLRNEPLAEQLLSVARQAAPDPAWGDRLRQIQVWQDHVDISNLIEEAPVNELSPSMLVLVGRLLPPHSPLQVSWLRRAQFQHPTDFSLNANLADAISPADPVEAAGFYRVALAIRPTSSATYNNLGHTLRDQKKLPEALAAFHKALELDPKEAVAYSNVGLILRDQRKLLEAVAAYQKAIEVDPKYFFAHLGLACTFRDQKKLPEAINSYRKAVHLNPKDARAQRGFGYALKSQGHFEEAIATYRIAMELEPDDPWVHNELAWVLANCPEARFRDPAQAVALATRAVELDPENGNKHNTLGVAHYRVGEWQAAVRALEKSMELRGAGDVSDWLFLAMAHWQLGDKAAASQWYEKAAQWMETNQLNNAQVRRFRAEAQELLGVNDEGSTSSP